MQQERLHKPNSLQKQVSARPPQGPAQGWLKPKFGGGAGDLRCGIGLDRLQLHHRPMLVAILTILLASILTPPQTAAASPLPQDVIVSSRTGVVPGDTSLTDGDLAACDRLTEEDLRSELNQITQRIFDQGDGSVIGKKAGTIDLDAIVERQWQLLDMDDVVDVAVDDAVSVLRRDNDLWNTFLSGWSPSKAEELARTVAVAAYGSESFRQALDALSAGIAADLEVEIAALSAESVSSNLICLQQFIERNYSTIVVDAFREGISDGAGAIELTASDTLDNGILTVLDAHKAALGGVGVIIAAQLSRKLVVRIGKAISKRVAGRLAGRLLGRAGATVIPLAGWIVGGGLIVYDVFDSLDGALPQIQQSLQSQEAKLLVQDEIVNALEPELQRELPQIARDVANELYAEWLDFKRQYRQLLAMSQEVPGFDAMVADSGDLAKAAALLDVSLSVLGSDGVDDAIESGLFERLLDMPVSAVDILRETGSVEAVLAWDALAGSSIDDVVALGLHRLRSPDELDKAMLESLLAVGDRSTVAKLAQVEPASLPPLFLLSSAGLTDLTILMTPSELSVLGRLLDGLEPERRNQLVLALLNNPDAMEAIVRRGAGSSVLASRDIPAAIAFLNSPADGYSIATDGLNVINGSVSLRLFGEKYGGMTTLLIFLLPLMLVLGIGYSLLSLMARPLVGIYNLFFRRPRV